MIMNIAEQIIEKLGGVAATATICGRTHSWVYKWTYPKERGGRGGLVPHEDAEKILAASARGECPKIEPSDFFRPTEHVGEVPQSAR